MIAIVDYGAGNLFSVKNALDYIGAPAEITSDLKIMESAEEIILPGVGAFPDAMGMLRAAGFVEFLREQAAKKPFLGICLGMQILFEKGYEFQETEGLGLIPGSVVKLLDQPGYKIPHMGWNDLTRRRDCPLLKGVEDGAYVYFVHSFRADTEPEYIAADTQYTEKVPALVQNGFVFGAQFHPEKSGEVGLTMLKNFADLV